MQKPFSQACENNKSPILRVLKGAFSHASKVLEVGSGTGQHAVYFASQMPHLNWQPSDLAENHAGINLWLNEANLPNLHSPIVLHIGKDDFPTGNYDACYSANTAHIMHAKEVRLMMEQIAEALPMGGVFCQYGPFTTDGEFSSDSNKSFHYSLLERGYGGYKDIQQLISWAGSSLSLTHVDGLPANNLMLTWKKRR